MFLLTDTKAVNTSTGTVIGWSTKLRDGKYKPMIQCWSLRDHDEDALETFEFNLVDTVEQAQEKVIDIVLKLIAKVGFVDVRGG